MFIKSSIIAVALIPVALSRMILIERDGRPFYPRRFGQEQCGGIGGELGSTCAGQICGVLGGRVPGVLLAAADACAQQDLADDIIDASKDQDATTASKMVSIAVRVRQCEKNTPPDFTKNPPALRNSVFCLKAPRNSQLDGLVQGQDPANDPTLFFDPATKSTVLKGSQANTFPFGQAPANLSADSSASPDPSSTTAPNASSSPSPVINAVSTDACPAPSTVTVTATATATPGPVIAAVETSSCNAPSTVTATITIDPASPSSVNKVAEVSSSSSAPSTTSSPTTGSSSQVIDDTSGALDFGSCTPSGVEFGPAFDGRKLSEFSFEPQDRTTFAQSSALNGQIVLNAFCNILNDKCKAPAATVSACKSAITAVANVTGGAKADGFNLALGIKTNFADIPAAPGGGPGSAALATQANFNKCDVPQLAFGIFDGRTENSFEPVGNGFVHGSALNPSIITTFICNTLVNSCDANQVAQDDCQAAIQATNGKTGQAVADAFNAAIKAHVA